MVRLRQLAENVRHRLLAIPLLFVIGSIVLSQMTLWADRQIDGDSLPLILQTTVGSGRAILSAIAGGLISSVTLLLSLMLVAVQLAGSQYSPRTLRNWIGDRTQQVTIGLVLGAAVFCLLILRETRTLTEGQALVPHLSVVLALVLGVTSLIAMVRSVDHLANRLRIGSVARIITDETAEVIERDGRLNPGENPAIAPASQPTPADADVYPPDDAFAITATVAGWVQQIDEDAIIAASPEGSTVYITVALGTFTMPGAPLAWVWPKPENDECIEPTRAAIALGDTRTMQQDIGFGILQLVDIALRALSPGVNDPNTANDVTAHLGVIMLKLWERPFAPNLRNEDGRKLVRYDLVHGDYLHAGFDQLRRYGAGDTEVASTILRVLVSLHTETRRRELPGPLGPIEEIVDQMLEAVEATDLSDYDKALVRQLSLSEGDRSRP